jgi:hypothetical protein
MRKGTEHLFMCLFSFCIPSGEVFFVVCLFSNWVVWTLHFLTFVDLI